MEHILFGDEATFHTCGKVNRHSFRVWATEKPNDYISWDKDSPKVNMWLGMTKSKIYGPFSFNEATVTG
jgi:hypothetical protein